MNGIRKFFSSFRGALAGRPQADRRFRWFGKIPTYADYIVAPDPPQWAQDFGQWIIEGFQAFRTAAPDSPPRMPDSLGILRVPRSGMTVAFVMRDFGGDAVGRPFPFAAFIGLPTEQCVGPAPDAMPAWGRVFDSLTRGLDQLSAESTAAHVTVALGSRVLELDDPSTSRLSSNPAWRRISWETWIAPVRPRLSARAGEWPAALREWGSSIAAHDHGEYEFNLCFPFGASAAWDVQTEAWLHWLSVFARLDSAPLTVFCTRPAEPATGWLSVLRRAAIPSDFLLLTDAADALRYVDSALRATVPSGPATAPSGDERASSPVVAPAVTAGPPTWGDFVDAMRSTSAPEQRSIPAE